MTLSVYPTRRALGTCTLISKPEEFGRGSNCLGLGRKVRLCGEKGEYKMFWNTRGSGRECRVLDLDLDMDLDLDLKV